MISLIFRQSTTAILPSVHLQTLRDQRGQLGDKVLVFFACSVLWLVLEGLVVGVSPPLWWWYWCGGLFFLVAESTRSTLLGLNFPVTFKPKFQHTSKLFWKRTCKVIFELYFLFHTWEYKNFRKDGNFTKFRS